MATVRVACSVPNGMHLYLMKEGEARDPETGLHVMRRDGPGLLLPGPDTRSAGIGATGGAPVITEVDEEWIGRWLEQNERSPLVTGGSIRLVKEDDAGEGS